MSLTSGYGLYRSNKALAYLVAFLEGAYFCVVSALFFLGAAVLCAAIAHPGGSMQSGVATAPQVWAGAAPQPMHALILLGYPLLVAVYWLPARASRKEGRASGPGAVYSFAQALIFLCVSAAYFLLVALLYAAIAQTAGKVKIVPFLQPQAWFGALATWMWVVMIGVYLLGVLLYWSRARVAGVEVKEKVSPQMIGKVILFCGLSVVFFILAALVYAAIAQAADKIELKPFWRLRDWFAALPSWMYLLAGAVYVLLVLLHLMFRAKTTVPELARTLLPPLIPFAKTAYFWAVTAAYLAGAGALYMVFAPAAGWAQPSAALDVGALLVGIPVWQHALIVVGYLLLITVYWAPGDEQAGTIELRGFTAFLILAAAVAGLFVVRHLTGPRL